MPDTMWTFLIVGTFGAVGAALAVGTLAALLRYYRTGEWPGQGEGAVDVPAGRLVALWVRVVLGAAVAIYAFVSLQSAGAI